MRRALTSMLLVSLAAAPSFAASSSEEAERSTIEKLRTEITSQLQLRAYDLLDELVYGWTEAPLFSVDTPVVLADVTVPVSMGSGLETLLENHFASLMLANRDTHMTLVHCPACNEVVVYSGRRGTVISRGVDTPEVMARVGGEAGAKHAVFLDFESEGSALVLRARVTTLDADLRVVFARALSSSSSTPALLRARDQLKSATEAREEYLAALRGEGTWTVPMRLVVRSYATGYGVVSTAPYVWVQLGAEVALTQAHAWTAGVALGYTWAPSSVHDGWLAQARINRLVSSLSRSLTHPDLYVFTSISAISVRGANAAVFRNTLPNLDEIIRTSGKPRSTFGAFGLGLELRVKNRIGASVFVEALPGLDNSEALGNYIDVGFLVFETLGAEVSFCF